MSEFQHIPAPFTQQCNEQGEIVDVTSPTSSTAGTLYWTYRLFEEGLRTPAPHSAQNWPPVMKPHIGEQKKE